MILEVACQICGRIISECDNQLGDFNPFTNDQISDALASASCEIDGTSSIAAVCFNGQTQASLDLQLANAESQLSDAETQLNNALVISQQNSDAVATLQTQLSEAQSQVNVGNAQISALQNSVSSTATIITQQAVNVAQIRFYMAELQAYLYAPTPNLAVIAILMNQNQNLLNQITIVAATALGRPLPPVAVGMTAGQYEDFNTYLNSIGQASLSALTGGIVSMTQSQFSVWQQYLAANPGVLLPPFQV